jgi:drug/metabolite transporter (DMT)-like permease
MKLTMIGGVLLIVIGVIALAYQGITYRSRDTVLDIGPLHATAEREHTLPLSPILGVVAVVGGVVLLVAGSRR